MKRIVLMLTLVLAIMAVSCTRVERPVACTMDAKACPDGSFVGRIAPDCEFAPCPEADGTLPTGKLAAVQCTDEQREVKGCTKEYMPVCGWFADFIKCVKYPCASVYGNKCMACQNPNVEYYTEGECPKEEDLARI
jgi:hypothetical protein